MVSWYGLGLAGMAWGWSISGPTASLSLIANLPALRSDGTTASTTCPPCGESAFVATLVIVPSTACGNR